MLSEKSGRKINILSFILFIGVMSIHTYNLEVYGIEAEKGSVLDSYGNDGVFRSK